MSIVYCFFFAFHFLCKLSFYQTLFRNSFVVISSTSRFRGEGRGGLGQTFPVSQGFDPKIYKTVEGGAGAKKKRNFGLFFFQIFAGGAQKLVKTGFL